MRAIHRTTFTATLFAAAIALSGCVASDLERALARETEATVAGFMDPETTRRIADF